MKWADIKPYIAKFAPMLGTALGGPLGGAAGAVLGNILGVKDAKPEDIKAAFVNGALTGDQLLALKKAEQDFEIQCRAMEINSVQELEALAVQDRASARNLAIQTKDWTPRILASGVTVGFFSLLFYLLKWAPPEGNKDVLNILFGSLGTAWIAVMNYYFGSSSGSQSKTDLLYRSSPSKED